MRTTCVLALLLSAGVSAHALGPEAERAAAGMGFGSLGEFQAVPLVAEAGSASTEPFVHAALDFSSVTWPVNLTEKDQAAIAIALNISGSFEGMSGWGNISGNFDGQGVSLGLLNQNLGQGSLQPMLIRMRERHPAVLGALFTPEHLKSLMGMLAQWEKDFGTASFSGRLSLLVYSMGTADAGIMSANDASVLWARTNLYAGAHFEPVWKAELVALAQSPEYVSLQIGAALHLHDSAVDYQVRIAVFELRAYLMLFDVVVQNGGIYPEDLEEYDAYVKKNPKATSAQKLEELLRLRLRHVRPQYVKDVRSRKRTIINGTGIVHGEKRNLPAEYSYEPLTPYR